MAEQVGEPTHDETERGWVLHVDLDQFLVAVEVRRRPELAGLPVVVGGDGDPSRSRQVVASASYEARAQGVRSGLSLAAAQRRSPDAVFLPSDRPAYDAASAEVMDALRTFPFEVEELGWDEAFLGMVHGEPEPVAREVQQRVLDDTGLHCAVGIGQTKLQAKTATGFAKPGGIHRLTDATWLPTMGDRPVTALNGVGSRTQRRLAELGIATVRQLAEHDHRELAAAFGPTIGPNLKLLGMGGHRSAVDGTPRVARSRSKEVTFEQDVTDRAELEAAVVAFAREVTEAVVADGRRVTHVALKIKRPSFFVQTRVSKLDEPTTDPAIVRARALVVLERFDLDRPVRLLGVRVDLE